MSEVQALISVFLMTSKEIEYKCIQEGWNVCCVIGRSYDARPKAGARYGGAMIVDLNKTIASLSLSPCVSISLSLCPAIGNIPMR